MPELISLSGTLAVPPAVDNAAPEWQDTLARIGFDVVLVSVEAGLDSPVWRFGDVGPRLGAIVEEFAAGRLEASLFQNDRQLHFFYVRRLDAALRALSEGLRRLGLLDISCMAYTGASAPLWVIRLPTATP